MISSKKTVTALALALTTLAVASFAPAANAEETTIDRPGTHPRYSVEIEPHAAIGWSNVYSSDGIGAGLRVSVPIVDRGFITSIDDSIALGIGADFLHYEDCYFADRCGANYLLVPATVQWNFFLAPHWSVFVEPGVFLYKGFFQTCLAGDPFCHEPSDFGAGPAFFLGGRYQMSQSAALALRLGYPTSTFGVSFM